MDPLEKFKSFDITTLSDKELGKLCNEILLLKEGTLLTPESEFTKIRLEYVEPVARSRSSSVLESMVSGEVMKRFYKSTLMTGADSRLTGEMSERIKEKIKALDPDVEFGPGGFIRTALSYDTLNNIITNE